MGKHYHVHIATVGLDNDVPITKVLNAIGGIDSLFLLFTANEDIEKGGNLEERTRTEDENGSTNTMNEFGSTNGNHDGNMPSCENKKKYTKTKSRLLAEKIEADYEHSIASITLKKIPMFDFVGIVQVVFEIFEKKRGPKVDFSVNITGGTNLMAAALCYVSYYINAKIYYAGNMKAPVSEQVQVVDSPKAIDLDKMDALTKDFLRIIYTRTIEDKSVSITDVRTIYGKEMKKQTAAYHKTRLLNLNLIEETDYFEKRTVDGRVIEKVNKSKVGLKVTKTGAMIAAYLGKWEETKKLTSDEIC